MRRELAMVVALSGLGILAAACDGAGSASAPGEAAAATRAAALGTGASAAPVGPVSFAKHVQPIFDSTCVRCHNSMKSYGNLDLSAGKSYAQLVNVACSCGGKRVDSAHPAASQLLLKLAGASDRCRGVMPMTKALKSFDPGAYGIVESWVSAGAPNN